MNIPLLDLKGQFASIRDEVLDAIHRVVESQYFILGPEVEAFEREIAAYSNCRFAVGLSSGTDALLASLMALNIRPGDEVLTTAYSFFATAGTVSRLGATPVFVDIDPATFNIEPSQIEARISERTRAIIPVHLFGQMSDMHAILRIAEKYNIPVIEDAAQAIGAELDGQRAGSMGIMGCLSFFPSKNLGGFGDGGMVTTNNEDIAGRIRKLRNHGFVEKYKADTVGGNFRLDAIQAAVLRVKLKHLDRWTEARQRNAALYRQKIQHAETPVEKSGRRHIYNQFVIRTPKRDAVYSHLKAEGIASEVYYPVPLHLQPCYSPLRYQYGQLPESERAAQESLALPIYPELTAEMIERVACAVNASAQSQAQ